MTDRAYNPFHTGVQLAVAMLAVAVGRATAQQPVLALPADVFTRLEAFESQILQRADQAFGDRQYRLATAEYDAFLLEFPRSPAAAYALYRQGRALQLDNKRFEAIRVFADVLDYYPDDVHFAAAAAFQTGQAHWDNGQRADALRAWASLADDPRYRRHPFAAGAINRLADARLEQGKAREAARYYAQVASDFRESNPDAARQALAQAVMIRVRLTPDEPALRELYEGARTFNPHPASPSDPDYWTQVIENVRKHAPPASGPEGDADARRDHFRYWAQRMDGRLPEGDDFQIAHAEFHLEADGDETAWIERLDRQFSESGPTNDMSRIIRWIGCFAGHPGKVEDYYSRLNVSRMTPEQILALMRIAFDTLREPERARTVFAHLKPDAMNDAERVSLARYLWHRDDTLTERVCAAFDDPDRGRMECLRFYHWRWWERRRPHEPALALADDLSRVPELAGEAYWLKAEMLHRAQRWDDAIQAYRASGRLPAGPFRIAECHLAAGRRDDALTTLRQIENFFPADAAKAALRIALIYRDAGEREPMATAFRAVLRKYPESPESSTAHLELEKQGLQRLGGGLDAD